MSTSRAVAALDWTKLTVSLGLQKETVAALIAFRKRNEEAKRVVTALKEQKTDVDFEHYRKLLKNSVIVNEAEKNLKAFKPNKVDLAKQLKIIDEFEAKAVAKAQRTASKVDAELNDLQKALVNIEQARPFEDLTVADVVGAKPEINVALEKMMKRGQWEVPGYEEKFGGGPS
ncbi:9878_t:CDS:2 [Paraglomus brasilianum]|uniref:ATP synthase subunit d, mitochondrial n=1 Tax=Paraglomus brasilianum TaxID=144538 RepID=A0A9N9F0M4_9GLOM|nr:9878_t:CDS:2 [Paraglomus brasilianum]